MDEARLLWLNKKTNVEGFVGLGVGQREDKHNCICPDVESLII